MLWNTSIMKRQQFYKNLQHYILKLPHGSFFVFKTFKNLRSGHRRKASQRLAADIEQQQPLAVAAGEPGRPQHAHKISLAAHRFGCARHSRRADNAEAQCFPLLRDRGEPVVAAAEAGGATLSDLQRRRALVCPGAENQHPARPRQRGRALFARFSGACRQ